MRRQMDSTVGYSNSRSGEMSVRRGPAVQRSPTFFVGAAPRIYTKTVSWKQPKLQKIMKLSAVITAIHEPFNKLLSIVYSI